MFKKEDKFVWNGIEITKEKAVLFIPKTDKYKIDQVSDEFIKAAKAAGAIKSKKPAVANYWDQEVPLREMIDHDIVGMIKQRVSPILGIVLLTKQRDLEWATDKFKKTVERLIEKKNFVLLMPAETTPTLDGKPSQQELELEIFRKLFPDSQIIEI